MNSPTDYLKKISIPNFDQLLGYSGLQRTPSTFSKVMGGVGLVSFGALVGAGLGLWLGSSKNRKQLSTVVNKGIEKVGSFVKAEAATIGNHAIHNGAPVRP